MKNYIILLAGIISFLISLTLVENSFSGFLFFFTIASTCIIHNREFIVKIISKSTLKEIRDLKKEKIELCREVEALKMEKNSIDVNEINAYKNLIKKEENIKKSIIILESREQQLNHNNIKLEKEVSNLRKIKQDNMKLQEQKEQLENEILDLKNKIPIIRGKVIFTKNCNLDNIDRLDGIEFEEFISQLFKELGYNTCTTKSSGDYGIDVIAEKDDIKYAIQCKNYSNVVGNKAIQEAYSGKTFYKCHVAIVITNNYFTHNAINQAESIGVVLWNRNKLEEIIKALT